MPVIALRIPQIGEGLQEARLVKFLKNPGDVIKRDEPIYQMETDKAVMDVESPYEGVLVEWLATEDQILPIGGEVGRMDVQGEVQEMVVHGAPSSEAISSDKPASGASIPPRTRAYAKEKGLSDGDLAHISASGGKLMPSDIDAFLANRADRGYAEVAVPQKQRLLSSRLVRGHQQVVPGTMSMVVDWTGIDSQRARDKESGADFQPSSFTMFAYAVAVTLRDFPGLRSSLVNDDVLRVYEHANLGIAVSLPGDELVLAVVDRADTLSWKEFAAAARQRIDLARTGKDQANESVTLSITNMQSFSIRDAVPVVVPPAVATLFLGEVYETPFAEGASIRFRRVANIGLTFDHRIVNGVGAAAFMKAVKERVETISRLVDGS